MMASLSLVAAGALLQRIAVPALSLGLAGALLLAGVQYVRAERALGQVQAEAAKLADYKATQERQAREALQAAAQDKARADKLRQEALDAEHLARLAAEADAARLRAGAGQLQRLATDLATSLGDQDRGATAASSSTPARATADLLADVLGRMDEASAGVVVFADQSRLAGQLCERTYDAVR